MVERRTSRLEGLLQVLQDVRRLELDIRAVKREVLFPSCFRRDTRLEIAGELTRSEHEVVGNEGLVVIREWTRYARFDDLECHFHTFNCGRRFLRYRRYAPC